MQMRTHNTAPEEESARKRHPTPHTDKKAEKAKVATLESFPSSFAAPAVLPPPYAKS